MTAKIHCNCASLCTIQKLLTIELVGNGCGEVCAENTSNFRYLIIIEKVLV